MAGFATGYGVGQSVRDIEKRQEIHKNYGFANELIEITNSDEFDQNRFEIKDFTGDKKADLKLYNKDGSFIIVDMDIMEILQEKN